MLLKFSITVSNRAKAEESGRSTETIAASKVEMNRRPTTLLDSSQPAKSRAASLTSSNGGRAPLLASQWRETLCGRRRCFCIKKQIIDERRLNTSAPNSSSRRFGFTACFECSAVLGHSCIFSIDFCPLMKPSTLVSTVAVLTDDHLIRVAAQAETQTH